MLKYANDKLKNDRNIVLATVSSTPNILACMNFNMKNDKEIVLITIKYNSDLFIGK